MMREISFRRVWAMPNKFTFDIPPIAQFVRGYLAKSKVSVDPFSGNKRWATWTNDLNPDSPAEYHEDALEWLRRLRRDGLQADLVIFDPPYSARQVAECYKGVGRVATMEDTQGRSWTDWKDAVSGLCAPHAIVLSFGWNSVGMGEKHDFDIEEIILVSHGGVHNDTICMAERRRVTSAGLFSEEP
jgi:hypothetical protein